MEKAMNGVDGAMEILKEFYSVISFINLLWAGLFQHPWMPKTGGGAAVDPSPKI